MVSIRAASANDKNDLARVHVRSWQVGYRGLISVDFLRKMRAEDRAARYTFGDATSPLTMVATEGEGILGFATFGVSQDVDGSHEGEIFALYVDPDFWGQGVGRALLVNARTSLRKMSFTMANLWVLKGNERATRFYEFDGWSSDGIRREEVVWGITVNEICFKRSLI
jgi:ribosomal protein S18 acetylase RimI-like enzyme